MATLIKSTPVKPSVAEPPAADSPGTWRHPRLNEITRRRNATTFTDKNVRRIAYNVVALLALAAAKVLAKRFIGAQAIPIGLRTYVSWAWLFVQTVPFLQIGIACLPLMRKEDDLSDIPLTAAQRKLLGLPPSAVPPTPDAIFSTPPRYSRTPSIAGSVGSRGSYTGSPLSGRGSPAFGGSGSGSGAPFSPPSSPLMYKNANSMSQGRRSSIGSPSPFSASTSANLFSDSGSPGSGGKRTSVGLNNKWLYEKGRRSSGSAWVH